jgi:sporulation protein YlmC with PRC-barrel domain
MSERGFVGRHLGRTSEAAIFVGFDLLDRQILDRDGQDVGKVDEVEFQLDGQGVPYLTALLVGPHALGGRLGGWLGRLVSGVAARLDEDRPGPIRIPYDVVVGVDSAVHLNIRKELLPEPKLEAWLREHVIARMPGSGHDG